MPTHNESIRLTVGGCINSHWTEWNVSSDIMIPADAFDLALYATRSSPLPPEIEPGAPCTLHLGDDLVLTGHVDDIDESVSKDRHAVLINGRDLAGPLTDCSAPLYHATQGTLSELIDHVTRPFGIRTTRIAEQALRQRIQGEPGRSAWDVVREAADVAGLWPWVEPDGTLVVSRPDYQRAPVGRLILRYDGARNNLLQLRIRRTAATRYTDVTVLGQHAAFDPDSWQANRVSLRGHAVDRQATERGIYRPYVVVDPACESQRQADRRAEAILADAAFGSFEAVAVVRGWRAPDGSVWAAGRRVDLTSEPHGIDGTFFIRGRRLSLSRTRGKQTELRICMDNTWLAGTPAGTQP
jgi:prophage tail gpP-like protein